MITPSMCVTNVGFASVENRSSEEGADSDGLRRAVGYSLIERRRRIRERVLCRTHLDPNPAADPGVGPPVCTDCTVDEAGKWDCRVTTRR